MFLGKDEQRFELFNNYTLTKDIATGKITKTYNYHPYILSETYDETNGKEIKFKDRYKKWRNITSLRYKTDKLVERVDGDGKIWAVVDALETYGSEETAPGLF